MNRETEKNDSEFRIFPLILGILLLGIGMVLLFFAYEQTFVFFFIFFFFGIEWIFRSNLQKIFKKNRKKEKN